MGTTKDSKGAKANIRVDKGMFIKEYCKNSRSARWIAKRYNTTITTVTTHLKKNNIKLRTYSFKGDKNPKWRGGKHIDKDGYVYVYSPHHPHRTANNTVFEHRLAMEAHIGRHLLPHEIVHHINHVINDNRIENLSIMSTSSHTSLHSKENVKKRRRDKLGKFTP